VQTGSGLKVPTDLSGVATGTYDWLREGKNYKAAVAPVSEDIRDRIQSLGKRDDSLRGDVFAGLDRMVVQERDGVLSSNVGGCEIRVVAGRLEEYPTTNRTVIVLPCYEYFDDECAHDTRSALGAYVNKG
jgi:hypothetical protein